MIALKKSGRGPNDSRPPFNLYSTKAALAADKRKAKHLSMRQLKENQVNLTEIHTKRAPKPGYRGQAQTVQGSKETSVKTRNSDTNNLDPDPNKRQYAASTMQEAYTIGLERNRLNYPIKH